MTPYNEFGSVEIARLQERLKAVEQELAEVKDMLSRQGTDITGLRVDVGSFITEVRDHIKHEKEDGVARDKVNRDWRSAHEELHNREAHRTYAALGILATLAVAASALLVHWIR